MNLRLGRLSPRLARMLAPGYGSCLRCETPWLFTREHSTPYRWHTDLDHGWSAGCFPLCERCWAELTPEERLPYYHQMVLVTWQGRDYEQDWPLIRDAVLAGR